jgi:hypothetical protein
LNDNLGFVSLENMKAAAILKTENGGKNWERIEVKDQQGNVNLEGIGFLSATLGWVGGWGQGFPKHPLGTSSVTTTGGAKWSDANEVGHFLNRFRFTGAEPIVAYASGATIYQCVATESVEEEDAVVVSARAFAERLESQIPVVTNTLKITAHVPHNAKHFTITIWDPRQRLVKIIADESGPVAGERSFVWDFTTNDGSDTGTGYFIYRVSIDDQVQSNMVQRPWRSSPQELGTKVIEMIRSYGNIAKRSHDMLVLPDATGNPIALKLLFDNPSLLMEALIRGGWVVPYHPDRSMFLASIIGTDSYRGPMQEELEAEDIQLLKDWIAAGAIVPTHAPGA